MHFRVRHLFEFLVTSCDIFPSKWDNMRKGLPCLMVCLFILVLYMTKLHMGGKLSTVFSSRVNSGISITERSVVVVRFRSGSVRGVYLFVYS